MKRVVIESPYAGDVERNLRYLDACMADCLRRGESPYASHGLYTRAGVLDDKIPKERELGIKAGFAWRAVADLTVVYVDLGVSLGMEFGISDAIAKGRPYEERTLGPNWDAAETRRPPAQSEGDAAIRTVAAAFGVSVDEYTRSLLQLAASLSKPLRARDLDLIAAGSCPHCPPGYHGVLHHVACTRAT